MVLEFSLENIVIKKIFCIYNINAPEKRTASRTDRRYYALSYKFEGKTKYQCDGKSYLGDSQHVLLLPRKKPYQYDILECGRCIQIEFDSDIEITDFHSFKISDSPKMRNLFINISQIWAAKSNGYMLASLSEFYKILHTVHLLSNSDYITHKKEKALLPAVAYIQENFALNDITNESLAGITGMSTVYFRKLFTKRYGVSPMRYLSNIRIETAKNMLLSDNYSVSDIAEAIGFSSVYSFSRSFKKATGLSPTEFLKENTDFSF